MVYKNYEFANCGKYLILQEIENNRVKCQYNVPVVECADSVYILQKTQIKAVGGARGLFCFMTDCIKNDFMVCLVDKIINHIKTMKIEKSK